MATLEVLSPKGQDFLELEGDRFTVGRSDANDLPLKDDSSLSRQHAVLERFGTVWYIRDLNSLNGIDINGEPVLELKALHNNDEIVLGRTKLVFRERGGVADTSTKKKMPPPKLTVKEKETLLELCRPLFARPANAFTAPATVREIGERMYVGEAAVKAHLGRMYDKFSIFDDPKINKRHELANQAIQRGCVSGRDYRSAEPDDS